MLSFSILKPTVEPFPDVAASPLIGSENGGTSIEDAPGIREFEGMKMYLAYLRDPSGNKLCAIKQL
jgi:hypothetical protein